MPIGNICVLWIPEKKMQLSTRLHCLNGSYCQVGGHLLPDDLETYMMSRLFSSLIGQLSLCLYLL